MNLSDGDRFGFDAINPRGQSVGNGSDVRVFRRMKLATAAIPTGTTDLPEIEVLKEDRRRFFREPECTCTPVLFLLKAWLNRHGCRAPIKGYAFLSTWSGTAT